MIVPTKATTGGKIVIANPPQNTHVKPGHNQNQKILLYFNRVQGILGIL